MNASIETQWIDVGLVDVPEYGRVHSPEAIEALAGDMTKNGQLQNAVVAKSEGGRYELVIGKGRLEAARKLGWEKIRADVKEGLTEAQKLAMIAAENEAREDACPFYTAMLYQKMMQKCGLTQEELGNQIGRDQPYVSRFLSLAKVPQEIWNDHQPELTSMKLCLEIAKAKDPDHQKKLVEAAAKDGLGTAAVKKLATKLKGGGAGDGAAEGNGAPAPETEGPFQITGKGKGLVIRSKEKPSTDLLDVYVQDFRCAVVDYLGKDGKASPAIAA
jgi:ParB family chromosome partitioning protein